MLLCVRRSWRPKKGLQSRTATSSAPRGSSTRPWARSPRRLLEHVDRASRALLARHARDEELARRGGREREAELVVRLVRDALHVLAICPHTRRPRVDVRGSCRWSRVVGWVGGVAARFEGRIA